MIGGLSFRELLPQSVVDEFDQLIEAIKAYLYAEHNEDGTHSDVTAASVETGTLLVTEVENQETSTGAVTLRALNGVSGPVDSVWRHFSDVIGVTAGKVLRLTSAAKELHVDLNGARSLALGVRGAAGSPLEQRVTGALTVMESLRFRGYGTYVPSAGDTAAFGDTADGPQYSVYFARPTADRSVEGIYTDLTVGGSGQVLLAINDSAFALTFHSTVVSNARKILGGPVTIGPGGSVLFVYDTANAGWQIAAVHPGDPIAYTPAWTAATTNPTIGDGTITGQWQQIGMMVHFTINILMGPTTAFGTGVYDFALPVPAPAATFGVSDSLVGQAMGQDMSVPLFQTGVTRIASTTTVRVHIDGTAGAISPTVPFTWANGDVLRIQGSYLRA